MCAVVDSALSDDEDEMGDGGWGLEERGSRVFSHGLCVPVPTYNSTPQRYFLIACQHVSFPQALEVR